MGKHIVSDDQEAIRIRSQMENRPTYTWNTNTEKEEQRNKKWEDHQRKENAKKQTKRIAKCDGAERLPLECAWLWKCGEKGEREEASQNKYKIQYVLDIYH